MLIDNNSDAQVSRELNVRRIRERGHIGALGACRLATSCQYRLIAYRFSFVIRPLSRMEDRVTVSHKMHIGLNLIFVEVMIRPQPNSVFIACMLTLKFYLNGRDIHLRHELTQ